MIVSFHIVFLIIFYQSRILLQNLCKKAVLPSLLDTTRFVLSDLKSAIKIVSMGRDSFENLPTSMMQRLENQARFQYSTAYYVCESVSIQWTCQRGIRQIMFLLQQKHPLADCHP